MIVAMDSGMRQSDAVDGFALPIHPHRLSPPPNGVRAGVCNKHHLCVRDPRSHLQCVGDDGGGGDMMEDRAGMKAAGIVIPTNPQKIKNARRSISRVLSRPLTRAWAVIHLGRMSPSASSSRPAHPSACNQGSVAAWFPERFQG